MPAAALDEARLDALYAQLQDATPEEAPQIAALISEEWSKSGSPTLDLLLKRGIDAMDAGDFAAAIDHFTALIDHAPDFAESYNGRAAAYYLTGRIGPAIDDLRQALVLNPRQFIALRGFAVILEELGREAEALEVYKRVLALHPSEPDTLVAVDRLEQKLAGRSL
jgi:tetratricopeptide (TPR) repeat protein